MCKFIHLACLIIETMVSSSSSSFAIHVKWIGKQGYPVDLCRCTATAIGCSSPPRLMPSPRTPSCWRWAPTPCCAPPSGRAAPTCPTSPSCARGSAGWTPWRPQWGTSGARALPCSGPPPSPPMESRGRNVSSPLHALIVFSVLSFTSPPPPTPPQPLSLVYISNMYIWCHTRNTHHSLSCMLSCLDLGQTPEGYHLTLSHKVSGTLLMSHNAMCRAIRLLF